MVQSSGMAVLSVDYGAREAPGRIVGDSPWGFDRAYTIKLDPACPSCLQLAVGKQGLTSHRFPILIDVCTSMQ